MAEKQFWAGVIRFLYDQREKTESGTLANGRAGEGNRRETAMQEEWIRKRERAVGTRSLRMVDYLFFSRSRISVSSFSSLLGSGAGAGSSSFFVVILVMPLIMRNTQKAMMRKSMVFWMNIP